MDLTPAQRIRQEHQKYHKAEVEDVPEPEARNTISPPNAYASNGINGAGPSSSANDQPSSSSAPGPLKSAARSSNLNTQSEEAFPSLGSGKGPARTAPTWGSAPKTVKPAQPYANGAAKGPAAISFPSQSRPAVQLPGRIELTFTLPTSSIKTNLRKPLADTLQDLSKTSAVKFEARRGANRDSEATTTIIARGSAEEAVRQGLKKAIQEVGQKQKVKISIPAALKSQIIGRSGARIKELQNKSGARIQLPPSTATGDDEYVEAEVEGDPMANEIAVADIRQIVGTHSVEAKLALRSIPPELYAHLLAQEHNSHEGVSIKIPTYNTWSGRPPALRPADFEPHQSLHIQVAGPSELAASARAQLEARAQELQAALAVEELLGVERERHRFILDGSDTSIKDFVAETGCSIILPSEGENSETIVIVGPPERIEQAKDRAIDLAGAMVNNTIDVSRQYQGPKEAQAGYLDNLSRYVRERQVLDAIVKQHNALLSFPNETSQPWSLWTRDSRSGVRARTDVLNAISSHPPSRFRSTQVHPFYQRELRKQYAKQLREQHGVHLIVPDQQEASPSVLLVFEGPEAASTSRRPSPEEVAQFEKSLAEAEEFLLAAIGQQEAIVERTVDAPSKYREKVSRFAAKHGADARYPVQFLGLDQRSSGPQVPVQVRGPAQAVDDSAARLLAFIEEQIRDEAERDYTTSCNFPKAFRGRLIGKDGETINKLRDDFDVEVSFKTEDDRVEIKGPPAKAEAAKAHIMSMARKAEDETTHVLLIPSRFHGELIGKGGSQVQKYQERYGVQVFFPFASDDSPAESAANRKRAAQKPNEVVIKGSKKNADLAKDDLWALYMDAQENSHTAVVSVAPAQIPALIGRDGVEARALRSETGADIEFPKSSDFSKDGSRADIRLKGSKDAVQKAKKLLEDQVKAFDQTVTKTLEVDKKHYRTLIGANGDNLRQMVVAAGGDPTQSSRIVQIPNASSSEQSIKIVGGAEVVQKLANAINKFIATQENRVTETIEVPPERHGALIGSRGSVKKTIESECSVTIIIPSQTVQGEARSQVKLIGAPDDIANAKSRIASILRQGAGETLQIPLRLHHAIADNGKFFAMLRREYQVAVDHSRQRIPPKAAPPVRNVPAPLITGDDSTGQSDATILQWDIEASPEAADGTEHNVPWVLKGDTDNVAKAKTIIEQALAQARSSVTGYLVLSDQKSSHSHVVGPGGGTIRRIRETTGCNPRVPPSGEAGAIEITGTRAQVEQAKDLIVKAVLEGQRKNGRRDSSRV